MNRRNYIENLVTFQDDPKVKYFSDAACKRMKPRVSTLKLNQGNNKEDNK